MQLNGVPEFLTKKTHAVFYNLRGYSTIFCELNKFNVKIDVIPNRLEKYMVFFKTKT